MSISSEIRRAGPFAGNGSTVNFPFTFKVFTTAQVVVTRTVSGVETVLTLTTHYTVSLNSNQDTSPGGTVTMLTAPASGQSITITSNVANLQPTVLANLGGFYPEVINDSLDRATIQIQQLDERLDRALVIPVSSSGVTTQLPVPEAGKILGWNSSGTAVMNYTTAPPSGEIYPVATYTALIAVPSVNRQDGMLVQVASRTTVGDGGGGAFRWFSGDQSANVTADPGQGIWVAPTDAPTGAGGAWQRLFDGPLQASWWGVVADATITAGVIAGTDNTVALNHATAYLRRQLVTVTTEGTNSLSLPSGFVLVTSANFTGLRGAGWAIHGNGCGICSKTPGKAVVDFLHSRNGTISNLVAIGDVVTPPRRGFQTGYLGTAATSASNLQFHNSPTVGYFTEFAEYNGGSEETTVWGAQRENGYATCIASICLDAQNEYGRFSDYQTGNLVAKVVTSVTKANPGVVTCAGHGYANGQKVKFGDITSMTELNGNVYTLANVTTDTFELSATDTTGFTTFTSGGFVWRTAGYSMVNIRYINSSGFSLNGGNGMVVVGGVNNLDFWGYLYSLDKAGMVVFLRTGVDARRPSDLNLNAVIEGANLKSCIEIQRNTGDAAFTGWNINLNGIQPDDQVFLDDNTTGTTTLLGARIEVDSVTSTGVKTVTGVTQANPGVVTAAAHGYSNGDVVLFSSVGGMTQLNGNKYTVAGVTTDTFELLGTDTTLFGTFTSGGTSTLVLPLFSPAAKWRGQGQMFLRPPTGLVGMPALWIGEIAVQDPDQWSWPAGSYEVQSITVAAAVQQRRYVKGETRFISAAASTIAAGDFDTLPYTSMVGAAISAVNSTSQTVMNGDGLVTPGVRTAIFVLADDAAMSFPLPATNLGAAALIAVESASQSAANSIVWVRGSGTPAITSLTALDANTQVTTGALTGTTGVDTKFTISVANDGRVYLENRRGSSLTGSATVIAAIL